MVEMPGLICSDIDGTLLDKEREISRLTRLVFKSLELPTVLASSRMPSAMYHIQHDLEIHSAPLICYNGAYVLLDNQPVFSQTIATEIVAFIIANCQVHCSLYVADSWYAAQADHWTQREEHNTKVKAHLMPNSEALLLHPNGFHKVMCMGEKDGIDQLIANIPEHYKAQLNLYRSKESYLEIAPANLSKASALEMILPNLNKSAAEVIAFGDNYNDIELLQYAGMGVAVANAKEEVKRVANAITHRNTEDGVARYLQRFL